MDSAAEHHGRHPKHDQNWTDKVEAGSLEAAWQFCLATVEQRRRAARAGVLPAAGAVVLPVPGWWPEPARELLDLYRPLLSVQPGQAYVIGHLAQGIDGTIATNGGSSRGLSGEQNHGHLHRLRALVDAVIVGASTAELDDPQLTVRMVRGHHPARVVIDPTARLKTHLRMFNDDAAPSIIVCAQACASAALSRWGADRVIAVDAQEGRIDLTQLFSRLRERELPVVLVEGGGVTVSRMLEANCLDHVQITVSPVLVGGARRGLQIGGPDHINDCLRPSLRLFRMGQDVLWELAARERSDDPSQGRADRTLTRLI